MNLASARILGAGGSSLAALHLDLLRIYGACTASVSYRGAQRFAWSIGEIFSKDDTAILEIFGNKKIIVLLRDGYWIKLIYRKFQYEPEIAYVLKKILTPHSLFLDCGANIGYWSIFASTIIRDPEQIVAVEPSERTFTQLAKNSEINKGAFSAIRAAIYSDADTRLTLTTHDKRHAGDSVVDERGTGRWKSGYAQEIVETITVDRIVASQSGSSRDVVVIKLDIEGAEIAALGGAAQAIEDGAVFLYEDHQPERDHSTTRFVFDTLGLDVFLPLDDAVVRINNVEELTRIRERHPTIKNFLAARKGVKIPILAQAD